MPDKPLLPHEAESYPYAPFLAPVPARNGAFDDALLPRYALCMTGEWVAVVLGALETLTQYDTWQSRQQEMVDEANRLLASWYDCAEKDDPVIDECCTQILAALNRIIGLMQDGGRATLDKLSDIEAIVRGIGTTTSVTDLHPSAPDLTYTSATGDDAGDAALRAGALCATLKTLFSLIKNNVLWNSAKSTIGQSAGVAFVPYVGWLAAGFRFIYGGVEYYLLESFFLSDDSIDAMICCLADEMANRPMTQAQMIDALSTCGLTDQTSQLGSQILINAMSDAANWGTFVHDLGAIHESMAAGATYDCPCLPEPCEGVGDDILFDYDLVPLSPAITIDLDEGIYNNWWRRVTYGLTLDVSIPRCIQQVRFGFAWTGNIEETAEFVSATIGGYSQTVRLWDVYPQNNLYINFDSPQVDDQIRLEFFGGTSRTVRIDVMGFTYKEV